MAEQAERARFLPRWAVYVMVPGFLGPALILGFIFVTESAHDEARCPFQPVLTRRVSEAIAVREDRRNCLWDVEERRFSVLRGDQEHALGRRRLKAAAFALGHYHWQVELRAENEVRVSVHNDGHPDAAFREGSAAERAVK
jgi:hypothetical protein